MELFSDFELDAGSITYEGKGFLQRNTGSDYIGTKDSPVYVYLKSDTDWATVSPSIAGVAVAVIVAMLSAKMQRNQIRSNISGFRSQWIKELRDCSAEYFQGVYSFILRMDTQDNYSGSTDFMKDFDKILNLTAKFEMLLSRDDEHTRGILEADQQLIDALQDYEKGVDFMKVANLVNGLKRLVREELERAWADVKSDVGFKSKRKSKKNPISRFFW
ncbi:MULTISPECIES: hypothetical protein [unclassified Pseudomonas]|uniref:hypothetical protein n=1 Tax=unclassified Pseudomonas TaxID=196821 RepID=UPI001F35D5E1|nr:MULTISPECIES: hypothetical protein [unclassified Pseudomonas]MCF5232432.1 hypothetical protein [Pseudomonas sp. PA-5-4H]MCF5248693.1 hypothetical protein [Pseudomonas sp. PA-5-4B]MCF5256785.1 hypothetical protein [Pseudomonas sp. PA-5-4B]MCF5260753.1 hypothetical protein [Pseudomonas sp. PA-5-4A]